MNQIERPKVEEVQTILDRLDEVLRRERAARRGELVGASHAEEE